MENVTALCRCDKTFSMDAVNLLYCVIICVHVERLQDHNVDNCIFCGTVPMHVEKMTDFRPAWSLEFRPGPGYHEVLSGNLLCTSTWGVGLTWFPLKRSANVGIN